MGNDDNNVNVEETPVNVDEQPSDKWIINIDEKIFYRHLPRSNDYNLDHSRMVYDLIGNNDVEIRSVNLALGPYRRIQNVDEQSLEKWIIDIDEKIFYRHLPRSNDYNLANSRMVYDLIGDNNLEIRSVNFALGPYRRILSE